MDQVIEFFKKLFDSSDWPPRWHCGQWTEFHGWLYIISDLLIWSAYFTIPIVIIRYISKKQGIRFIRLYFLFAAFILACGATHFLDAIAFWIPAYRLSALVRFITGALSWVTVFYLVKLLPAAFSLKSQKELETEIEQRKKAEEQVRESEEQMQTIFDAAPDAVIVIDESGKIIKWNPKAEALFGWKENEVTGKLLSETIIPDRFRETHTKGMKHFLRTGEGPLLGKVIETCAITKDNTELDVALNIAATKKIKDRYLFIGFVRDITEQRKAELQIQKQKQDIQDFIDSMSTLCAKVTTGGELLMVNKTTLQATGISIEELLRTNFTEGKWWTFDPEVHLRVRDAFKKACSGIAINYDENIFVFGQVLTINFSLIPILSPDSSVDYIVAEGRDITAQKKGEEKIKESEEKLSMIFNSIDEGFCIIEMIFDKQKKPVDYRFLVINPSFEKQTGLRDAVGKRMREFAPDHEEHWFETYGRIALTGESIRFENRAEQLHRWYDVYAFRFGEPKNLQVAILFNDITDRKQTEKTIRQLNQELEKRVEEKTREIIHSEKKFRNLVENSTDIISLSDENFRPVYRSPSAVRITGWTNEEREKVGGIELTHPDDLVKMKMVLKEILENPGKPFQTTFRTRHKDGHYIWMEGMMTNMLHDESIKAIVGNMRDITESKKAQDLLQVSESRFRSIIEQFPYPVVTYTPDGSYTNANEAWEIMWQYKREDVKDYNIRKDPQMIASGLSVYVEKAFAGEVATSEPYLYDPVLIGHDSRKRWMQMTLYPLKNAEGEILEVILVLQDVTENKEAEASIRKSVKEISDYKYALDESSIVAITDQKGIIKYVNNNFCSISKYSREELIGQDHRIINSGYHPKEFIRNLWVTITNGQIWKGEVKNKAKDDTIYWVDTTIIPFLDEEGKPYQYVAIKADITERKKAEQALHESQQLLSAIIDNSTAVIYVKDLQGRYLLVNRRFSELFHLSMEAIPGKTDYDFFSKEDADAFRQMDVRTAAADHALTEEEKVPLDDGLHTYISVKSTLRDDKGKPHAIFGISTDITEHKRAEEIIVKTLEEKNTILESIGDAFFAVDKTWTVTYWNRIAEIALGVNKQRIVGKNLWEIFSDSIDSLSYRKYHQAFASNQVVHFEDYYAALQKWYEISAYPSENGLSVYFKDVTERQKAAEEIQKLNTGLEEKVISRTEQLKKANEELEAFTYSVSHDLRAPLRGIIGFTAILEEDYSSKLDEEAMRITGIIKSNTLKMGNLIDDLLTFSRMGRQDIEKSIINTHEIVQQIITNLENKNTSAIEWIVPSLHDAYGDINTIRQVFINLISNAIKYSGGKTNQRIEIGSALLNGQVAFFVKDNGVGFDIKYSDKLFKVFQRLHGTNEFEGTGVGLAIVEKIISKHGGKVWAEGEVDKGASFYFSLPSKQ